MGVNNVNNPIKINDTSHRGGLTLNRGPSSPVPCTGKSLTFSDTEIRAHVLACTVDVRKFYRKELDAKLGPVLRGWSTGNPCPFCGQPTLEVNLWFGSTKCSTCGHYCRDIVVFLMASRGISMEGACGLLEGTSHE